MLILSRNYGGPPKPAEEAGWHNTEIMKSQATDCKPLIADTTMSTLPMLNHSVITRIHCLILVYQQFRGRWTISVSTDGFSSALEALYCLPGWTQTGGNGKNKWVKQYAMIITACHRQKFRNQNWRYGHQDNHFGLNANFDGPFFISFQGTSQFSGYFRDLFRGFSGFLGVAGLLAHVKK